MPAGSRYQSARLRDPDVAAALAEMDEDDEVPLEGFGPLLGRLASIEDRLTQLLWATAKTDPSAAPAVPRPQYPHLVLREDNRRARMNRLTSILTGGE